MKEFKVFNEEKRLDYIIKSYPNCNGQVYELITSNEQHWTENFRNHTVLKLTDDGDGFYISKQLRRLDYDVFMELLILMNLIKNNCKSFGNYTIEKTETILKL